jgi:hypothetical protein
VLLLRGTVSAPRRDLVTWLTLSPLVVLQMLGGMHLESVLCLLLVAAALLYARGHLLGATAVTVLACEVKATAGVLLVVLLIRVLRRHGLRVARRAFGVGIATATAGLLLLPSDPFGWVRALGTPGSGWVPFTPSTSAYLLLSELGVPAELGLRSVCTWGAVALGIIGLLVLLARDAGPLARLAGAAWLVMTLSGPALWPWYLAPAGLLLLIADRRASLGVLVLGALPALAGLPIGTLEAQRVTAVAEISCAVAVGLALARRQSGSPGASILSRPASAQQLSRRRAVPAREGHPATSGILVS